MCLLCTKNYGGILKIHPISNEFTKLLCDEDLYKQVGSLKKCVWNQILKVEHK